MFFQSNFDLNCGFFYSAIFWTIDNSHFIIFITRKPIPRFHHFGAIFGQIAVTNAAREYHDSSFCTILVTNITYSKTLIPMAILINLIHFDSINDRFYTKSARFGKKVCFLFCNCISPPITNDT